MDDKELKDFLDEKACFYETPVFVELDPISIPHRFSRKEDIEIAGMLAATISWGNRAAILKSAHVMMDLLDNSPADFVTNATAADIAQLSRFVYRTFQADDLCGMVRGLQNIYANGGLEAIFTPRQGETVKHGIARYRAAMVPFLSERTYKHLADVERGSAAKRINMFLRWMVRPSQRGVDFGIWKNISPAQLMLPLDVHTGNVGRALGIISRKQNDWRTVEQVTVKLAEFCPSDPVKYDYALFGLGVFEKWK